jgi:hypothetical protein
MVNPFKEVNWTPDTAEKRTFGKSLVIGFPVLALVLLVVLRVKTGLWDSDFPLKLAGFGAVAGVLSPPHSMLYGTPSPVASDWWSAIFSSESCSTAWWVGSVCSCVSLAGIPCVNVPIRTPRLTGATRSSQAIRSGISGNSDH